MVTSLLMIGNDLVWNGADVEIGRANTAEEGLVSLSRRAWDVIAVGRVSDATTESVLSSLARRYPTIPVIVVANAANDEIRRLAWEVADATHTLAHVVARAAEVSRLRREVARLGREREDGIAHPGVARAFTQGSVREMERLMIEARLDRLNQNRTHAAASLEISVRTLRNKLREYREAPRVEATPAEPR
ncbi:MAG TPA: helix-turn-helix domain-containing protein [Candidatus Krumholzibacteria bacterium]|nr:helix-turn-helix domain-containing protein [Candidatus Krumholzibacteria bacterium]